MSTAGTLFTSDLHDVRLLHRGKVRDMYDAGDRLLMVTTDRLSAFDVVFPTPVPGKGRVLAHLSAYWFRTLADVVPNHFLGIATAADLARYTDDAPAYVGRVVLSRPTRPLPVECIVRGSLEGSGWKEYRERGTIQEHALPSGLQLHDRLPAPIFTPSTKAESGHDENIDFDRCVSILGADTAERVRATSLALFERARDHVAPLGIELADTKFEFGFADGELLLIDEALTPDSSRFLMRGPDGDPVSYDKQFVRDWIERSDWDKCPPAPELPAEVVAQTAARYREIARRITGEDVVE